MSHFDILNQLPNTDLYYDEEMEISISYRYKKKEKTIPILFLHGFNGNSKSWAYQFKYFDDKHSIIAIDAPGFGKSDVSSMDMYDIAKIVMNLLKSLNILECYVVGHSMGGMLAQIMASQYNALVKKLILSCTHKGYGMPSSKPLMDSYCQRLDERKTLSDKDFGMLRINRMLPGLKNKEIFNFLASISEEINEGSITSGGMAMQTLDTSNDLSKVTQECMIITASEDIVVTKERSSSLKNSIPHAITRELLDVGHAPYCEDHKAFNDLLEKFI